MTIGGSNQLICVISKCELIGRQHAKHVAALSEVRHLNANDAAHRPICLLRVREDALEFLCRALYVCQTPAKIGYYCDV